MKSKKIITLLLASLMLALSINTGGFTAFAGAEAGEGYFMYNFEKFDGITPGDSLPFGKGGNGNCYFPKSAASTLVFPEVYTWGSAELKFTDEGTVATATKAGGAVLLELDKAPTLASTSIDTQTMNALVVLVKSSHKADGVNFSVVSQGNTYKKTVKVNFTGEFQEIVIDLASEDGWFCKGNGGKYDPYVDGSPWTSGSFSKGGVRVDFPSLGTDVTSSFTVKHIMYTAREITDNANVISNGVETHNAYIKGYSDGTFRPSATITRAEAVTIIARELGLESAEYEKKTSFSDVTDANWYFESVAFLEALGSLKAFSGRFDGNKAITRAEFVSILPLTEKNGEAVEFSDVTASHPLFDSVNKISTLGVINGYPDGTFRPDNTITRAEAVKVTNAFFGRKIDNGKFNLMNLRVFSDVDESFWAFGEIYEAATSHKLLKTDDGEEWRNVYETITTDKTGEKIAEIDKRADEMREKILNTKTDVFVFGNEFYVSASGNDANDGKSPEKPWQTLKKVSETNFKIGDVVYFKRGDTFRGQLVSKAGITYSAYGEGEKPRLYGSPENGAGAEKWSLVDGTTNIWKFYKELGDIGLIVFNDGKDRAFKLTPSYVNGNYVDAGDRTTVVDPKDYLKKDLDFVCFADSIIENGVPRIGNYSCVGEIYLRCDKGNPGTVYNQIEFNTPGHVIANKGNNNTYDNLCIKYGGFHGIGSGTTSGLIVTNCEIGWIGGGSMGYGADGSLGRYGNAIEIYGGCDEFTVDNCYIYQAYDCGPTHQLAAGGSNPITMKDVTYSNNLIEYCTYSIEYFLGKPSVSDEDAFRMQYNVLIENNVCRYAGYGFGEQRRDKGSAAHIKGWDHYNPSSDGYIIRNNVFDRSRHMMIHCGAGKSEWLPQFSQNVWIQYYDSTGTLGRYRINPTVNMPFDSSVRFAMINSGLEANPEIYFAENDEISALPIK